MRLVALLVCAGCDYNPEAAPSDSDQPGDTSTVTDTAADQSSPAPCETPDATGLVLCYQFDNDLGMLDDSGPSNLDNPTVTGMSPITRTVNGTSSQAAMIGSNVAARIEQTDVLELTGDYTIVGWLMPVSPSSGNDGLLDHNGQWAFSIEDQQITCWWSRTGLQKSLVPIAGEVWQLAACVISGTMGCAYRIDQSGAPVMSCRNDLTGPAPAGNSGVSIGSFQSAGGAIADPFRGAIDDFRVYSRALTVDELCTLAGRPGCP